MDSSHSENDDPTNVSEEAILDSLFFACDTERSGRVSVSKLIDYLRNAVSNGTEEFAGNLDDLTLIWDPDGMDIEIDLTSFQEGIKEWISEIRKRSFANVEDGHCPSPVTVNCMDSAASRSYGSPEKINSHVTTILNGSSDSVEGLGGKSPDKDWPSELISTIEKLQLNNRRLIEQHSAIQAQLESAEELNGQLSAEVESLRKQLRSYQLMIDKSKEKEKENLELRQAVSDALEANQTLQTKIAQLERERSSYENNVNEIGEKLLEAQAQVELLEEERRQLINDLAEQKQYCTDLQEIQGVKNDIIAKESSTNSSMIVGLAAENETLKMEKSRLETRILDLEESVHRLQRNELLAEKSKLAHDDPVLNSTPFSRQSSLQKELEAQETCETKGLPSPIVGSQFSFNDSLDGDDLDVSLTGMNQSWMSGVQLDSTSTSSSFEKYSLTAFQMANEFKEKKQRALKQIDELAALDRSMEVKDKKEVLRDQLAQDLDSYAEKVSSLSIKKKVAEKRAMKLLAAMQKLKDENKQLSEERGKAYQKLGTMALCNDEMSARLLEFESRLENRTKTVAQQSEEMAFLEQQLSKVTEDLFKIREEKEDLTRSLVNEKRLSSSLEVELASIRKNQEEVDKEQLLLLVKIKELENELGKTTTQLNMEKRRTANLEESIQLSVSRHSDELRDIFDSIPSTDTEGLNRSRQSPRASSPCITGHMVRTKLFDFVSHVDTSKLQGVDSNSPDDSDNHQPGASSILSTSESPSGKFLQLVDIGERDLTTTASQTDFQKDAWWTGSEPDALKKFERIDLKDLTSTGSQTDLLREIGVLDLKDLVSTGSQTDLLRDIDELIIVDTAETIETNPSGQRRRRSGVTASPVSGDRTIETALKPDTDGLKSNSEAVDSGKLSVAIEEERKATNVWRKKLSVAFKFPEEFESYASATGQALENSVGSSYFVDGVSLHVSPAPNEKEIEKQFKTLVLAFHTDQDTLSRRLEVLARARDMAESNMNKELQSLSKSLKEFEQLCITKDMQDMLSFVKSQVEVLKTSSKRMSTQSEQHGCVQQEARMSSGVEVMICHAENLSRHLERVREDLDELRRKERLEIDEPVTRGHLANGPTRYDSQRSEIASAPSLPPDKPDGLDDGAKQNSLLNFVMAFHTTSMRAKEALKNFRRRSGASRQGRSALAVSQLQTDESASATESTVEGESSTGPEVVVNDTEEDEEEGRGVEEAAIEGEAVVTDVAEETVADEEGQVLSGPTKSNENDSEPEVEEFESQEEHSSQTPKRPGVCWRYFSVAFRFSVSFIILMVLLLVGLTILDGHSTIKIDTYFISSKVRKVLEPVAQLVYNVKPPE